MYFLPNCRLGSNTKRTRSLLSVKRFYQETLRKVVKIFPHCLEFQVTMWLSGKMSGVTSTGGKFESYQSFIVLFWGKWNSGNSTVFSELGSSGNSIVFSEFG